MRNIFKFFIFLYIIFPVSVFSQNSIVSPMQDFLRITSAFGDIRSNSFHFGIDYSTNGKLGIPVRTIKKGYVSRIKVESGGYGRVIYITHEDSTTSVYAHLDSFIPIINEYVIDEQYKRKSFKVDIIFEDKKFLFKKGDTIGYSGNSGQSSGPHLHFELRNTKTQNPINAFIPSINKKDNIRPVINRIHFYNIIKYLDGKNNYLISSLNTEINNTRKNLIVSVPNKFCIGIEAHDYISDTSKKLSIYSAQLYVDDTLIYEYICDELNFDQMKSSKGVIDYLNRNTNRTTILYLFRLPNVELIPIKTAKNDGIITIQDSLSHEIRIVVADKSENKTEIKFQVKQNSNLKENINNNCKNIISWRKENILNNGNIKIIFPKNSLFADICIDEPILSSRVLKLGNENIPLKNSIQICFPDSMINKKYISKSLVVRVENNKFISCGGEINDNYIIGKSSVFGSFSVTIDTIPPKVVPINFIKGTDINNLNEIIIKITDELAGIKEYNGYIDNNWILFEYDEKTDLLKYVFDYKRFKPNNKSHTLTIEVTDKKGNTTIKKYNFIK